MDAPSTPFWIQLVVLGVQAVIAFFASRLISQRDEKDKVQDSKIDENAKELTALKEYLHREFVARDSFVYVMSLFDKKMDRQAETLAEIQKLLMGRGE